jgi:predicted nucleotidyltransferase
MRLAEHEIQAIREEILTVDPDAEIFLHGSRIDDARQGGDIDLVVVTDRIDLRGLLRIRRCILDRIGWQRLDLTIRRRDQVDEPLAASARVEGVRL